MIPISATLLTALFVYPLFSCPLVSNPLHLISPHPHWFSHMHICCLPASRMTWYSLMNTGTKPGQTLFHRCSAMPPQVHCYSLLPPPCFSEGVSYSYPIIYRRRIDRPV
ncbi:hypothetical protein BP00DRAFT_116880 [Aspergillus indologenus CBS 114.80]|uniref:Secreted protein n=1 Tax=Aspergillus indologenus CBS 114.80 TaxID=1450541 RepID=A0A2V5HLB2_9EURO|nr:hypothetical protein BP00DRAFT_116880 [Aspergillus indologenus CBS 114.80]